MVSQVKIRVAIIVFDQGNTLLLDPFPSVIESRKDRFSTICHKFGLAISPSLIASEWKKSNKIVDYPFIGHFYQEEPIVQHALRALGIKEDIAAILALELLREYRIGLREVISLDPRTQEVKRTLQELKARGKKLAVFSNDRAVALGLVLNGMGIKPLFQYVGTSESLGVEKPAPRVFAKILEQFSAVAETVAYVGDEPIKDIEAAKKQGLKAIQYRVNVIEYNEIWRDYQRKSKYKPDAVIGRFSELLDIIE